MKAAKEQSTMKLAIAAAQDEDVLIAVCNAAEMGLIEPILVGDSEKINQIASSNGLNISTYQIIEQADLTEKSILVIPILKCLLLKDNQLKKFVYMLEIFPGCIGNS